MNFLYKSEYWGDDENNNSQNSNSPNNSNNSNNFNKSNNKKPIKFNFFYLVLAILFAIFCFNQLYSAFSGDSEKSYSEFQEQLENNKIKYVDIVDSSFIRYRDFEGRNYKTNIPYRDDKLLDKLNQYRVDIKGSPRKPSIIDIILNSLPLIIFIYIAIIIVRQSKQFGSSMGGLMGGGSLGASLAREYKPNGKDAVKFSDVAGQKEAKEELMEVVEFLKDPKKFSSIGARIPRGVLLVGPPGTGKTLIARAVAGESKVSFLYTSGSDFVEMFVGMGASRVRSLFSEAKKKSPCIIFIDEIDAVGRSRGAGLGGGHDEREQTLNQILVEMDGFDNEKGIIVMAATNRADVLDDALLRPGRFDRRVSVELPDIREREDILKLHFKKIKTDNEIDFKRIARATPGTSGADLANLANESALLAARHNRPFVTMSEVELARDKILLGTARNSRVISPDEKTATAYHEAGHTLLHYYVKGVDPLHKVTIIPHGNALGLTMSLPENDMFCRNKDYLLGRIKVSMGGYAAEELVYGQTTTGTSNDIKQATRYAQIMVTELGMSKLGFVNYSNDDQPIFLGREIAQHKNYSEETARIIDQEVRKILDDCMNDVRTILKEHRDQLDTITQHLVEKETLDDNEIRELIGLEPVEKASDLS